MDKMKEIRNRLSENDELKKLGVTEDVIESTNYVKMLYSNFRMNEALSDYSAQKIYNNQKDIPNPKHLKYSGYNEAIRNQVLRLKENWREDLEKNHSEIADWAKQVLNPEYPFVVIYLSNAAADKMSELERQMVSDITYLLQKYMVKADGSLYFDLTNLPQATHSFWGTNGAEDVQAEEHPAFGILSPYHEQIEALKKRIAKDMEERYADFLEDGNQKIDSSNFLVDTVNKLQGQEREAIVVSYGVDDVEKAIEQGEFIYSYQRLNVSLTRGKKKTILFLTDALTDYPIEMLDSDNQELLKGVSFMCDMRDYFESDEPEFESEKYSFKEPDNEVTIDIYRRRHKS
jgi:hypothetical protein